MQNIVRIIVACILLFGLKGYTQRWYRSGSVGDASYIGALVKKGPVLYAGTWGGGVYFSVDSGNSWKPMNNGLKNKHIYTILAGSTTLMVGTEGGGVFKYHAEKMKWQPANNGIADKVIFSLAEGGGVILAATWMKGLYRSTDGGNSWKNSNNGMEKNVVYIVSVQNGSWYAGTARNGVYRSSDTGRNWEQIGLVGKSVLGILPLNGVVWFGTWKSGIYRYTEGKGSWSVVEQVPGEPVKSFVFQDKNETIYCAKRMMGIFASDDYGQSCRYAGLSGYDVFSLTTIGDLIIAGTWGNGIFTLNIADTSWTNTNQSLELSVESDYDIDSDKRNLSVREETNTEKLHDPLPSRHCIGMYGLGKGYILDVSTCFPGRLIVCYTMKNEGKISINLYNYFGRLLKSNVRTIRDNGIQKTSFCTEELAVGVYYVILKTQIDTEIVQVVHLK